MNDEKIGYKCTGCGTDLTYETMGGYRMYCEKCVSAMPLIPHGNKGYYLEGKYPDFRWVE